MNDPRHTRGMCCRRRVAALLCVLVGVLGASPAGVAQQRQDVPAPALWELKKANECLQKQNCDCAIPSLERAVQLYASYVDALVGLGYCYFQKGRLDDAIARANTALSLSKRESLAYLTLGMAYEQQGKLSQASENYQAALRLKRSDPAAHLGLARVYERSDRDDAAILEYKAVLDQNPQNLGALTALGQLYFQAKKYKEAEEALRQILKISPDSPAALMRLGSLYIETKQFEKAVESLQAVLKIDYNQPIIHFRLGETYMAAGKIEPATTHYSIAAELDPNFLEAKMKLAAIKVGQKQVQQALELYEQVIAAGKSNFLETACQEKVRLLLEAGQRAKAAEAADLALGVFPDNAAFIGLAAQRKLASGQVGPALELAKKFTTSNPKDAEAWTLRGSIELQAGNAAEAEKSLQTAVQLDAKNPHALAALGYVEAVADRVEPARAHLEQALALQPDIVPAMNNLALLKLADGPAAAAELLGQASKAQPESTVLRNNLAVALARAGKLDQAQPLLEALVQAQPNEPDWKWNLALVLQASGRTADALKQLQPLADAGSKDPLLWRLVADLDAAQNQLDAAESAYRKAADLATDDPALRAQILYNLGTTSLARGPRRNRAQGLLADAAKLDPNLPEAQNNLGCLSFLAGRTDEARVFFRTAFRLRPAEKTFLMNLIAAGEVLTPDQIARAEQLSAQDRNAAESQVGDSLLAQGYAALGAKRYAEAAVAFGKAKDSGVRTAELENATGVSLVHLKRFDEARTHLEAALQLAPNAPEVLLNLALLFDLGTGDATQATTYYERYLAVSPDPKIAGYVDRMKRFGRAREK
jgi:Flp pilus assembly protein TadD